MESEGLNIKFEALRLEEENVRKCIYILGTGLAPPHICVWVCTNRYTHICGGQRSTSYATPMCVHTYVSAHAQVHSHMWRQEVCTHVCECAHMYIHTCGGQRSTSYALPHVCVHTCVWVRTHRCTHTCGVLRSTLYVSPTPPCVYTHIWVHTHRHTHTCADQRSTSYALPHVYVHTCVWVHTHKYTHTCRARGKPHMSSPRMCVHTCLWVHTHKYTHTCGGQRSTSYAFPYYSPPVLTQVLLLNLEWNDCLNWMASMAQDPPVPSSPTPPLHLFTQTLETLAQFLYPQSSLISRQDFLNKAKYFKTSESYKNNF